MEECELCGRQTKDVYIVSVEGVEMRTCPSCAKGKKVIAREEPAQKRPEQRATSRPVAEEDKELVDNYGAVIKKARESMKIPIKVLAEMLNEKEHMLLNIEEQRLKPTIKLTKKLEKALGIKLTDEEHVEAKVRPGKNGAITVGDFMNTSER